MYTFKKKIMGWLFTGKQKSSKLDSTTKNDSNTSSSDKNVISNSSKNIEFADTAAKVRPKI